MFLVSIPFPCDMVPRRDIAVLHVSLVFENVSRVLLTVCNLESAFELVCFIVLDIGLDVTESLPPWTRVVAGLFQSFAVRASGFPIVSIASLAPSFQYVSYIL